MRTINPLPIRLLTLALLLPALLLLAFPGCGGGAEEVADSNELVVWAHRGKAAEWDVLRQAVKDFNASNAGVTVRLVELAEDGYDTQVQAAAADQDLPDVLELDGPLLANYAWKGYIVPIGDQLDARLRGQLLPSIVTQGTWNGTLYAVGQFDSGLGLYADRKALAAVGARIPTRLDDAWTIAEFNKLLEKLAAHEREQGADGRVLDIKRDYRGEWWTYGFQPVLVSAGAGLLDEERNRAASTLDSPQAAEALSHVQRWVLDDRVDPNADGNAFVDRRAAISWVGHWEYPRYHEALGDDLVVLPLPDFGHGTRTGMGSWCWSVTRRCQNVAGAMDFIRFLLQTEQVLAMTAANGAVPATGPAVEKSPLYGPGGDLRLFAEQLRKVAVPRPRTPAYPVITSAFSAAMEDILNGAEVGPRLAKAARTIDQEIQDNEGYPTPQ